ncbi:MAG: DUF624 domain-containing protein [Clostridia bacterium]|nr:DUF624 domain-containing protein [Clostridia bacterium]
MSLVYSALSILIIPSGLAASGMTNVARNLARDKHSFGLSDFFETIKKNWKQSLIAGIINTVIDVINGFAIYFYWFGEDALSVVGFGFSVALFILFRFMKYHLWLLVITFKLPLKKMYKNCFLFAFVNWKANIVIALCEILLLAICVAMFFIPYYIAWVVSILLAIAIFPGFINLLTQLLIFPKVKELMIDPYYEAHPEEDVELRRNLGLEVEEEDDSVFEDKHIASEEK